jgi:hypothetical protein
MVLVSRRLEDLKTSLGLEQKVLGLGLDRMVLVLIIKSCNFQDLQLQVQLFYHETIELYAILSLEF